MLTKPPTATATETATATATLHLKALIIILGFGISVALPSACSPTRDTVSSPDEIITDLGQPDGASYYYRLNGEQLTRSRCLADETNPAGCQENSESVDYQRFQLELMDSTPSVAGVKRFELYELLESSAVFRPRADNLLLADLRPLLDKFDAAFELARRGKVLMSIVAAGYHSCALTTEGQAYCWGFNPRGMLGAGIPEDQIPPTLVAENLRFVSLATDSGSCGLTQAGQAYCWGDNSNGQLGTGDLEDRRTPIAIAEHLRFTKIIVVEDHACGLTQEGKAYCWGRGSLGRLGTGDEQDRLVPTAVFGDLIFKDLTAGGNSTCALTEDGKAYCWGRNDYGQLGTGDTEGRSIPTAVVGDLAFISLATAGLHTCGIAQGGKAYCWGFDQFGQLGAPPTGLPQPTPVAVGDLTFTSIAVASWTTCAIATTGKAYCWGDTLGDESNAGFPTGSHTPTAVSEELTFNHISVGCANSGRAYACGIAKGGKAYCWGHNGERQLGIPSDIPRSLMPVAVEGEFGLN